MRALQSLETTVFTGFRCSAGSPEGAAASNAASNGCTTCTGPCTARSRWRSAGKWSTETSRGLSRRRGCRSARSVLRPGIGMVVRGDVSIVLARPAHPAARQHRCREPDPLDAASSGRPARQPRHSHALRPLPTAVDDVERHCEAQAGGHLWACRLSAGRRHHQRRRCHR
jgi:hypothetical protein